ncbi:MAG: hypothetical protein WBP40_01380 [Candidatus Moraniibacteriota bacterium]
MNHKPLFLTVALIALLVIAGAFWYVQKREVVVNQLVAKDKTQEEQRTKNDEIESIRDLIDGEYAFTPVDTSDWKTYRNEEAGFEIRIPYGYEKTEQGLTPRNPPLRDMKDSEKDVWFTFGVIEGSYGKLRGQQLENIAERDLFDPIWSLYVESGNVDAIVRKRQLNGRFVVLVESVYRSEPSKVESIYKKETLKSLIDEFGAWIEIDGAYDDEAFFQCGNDICSIRMSSHQYSQDKQILFFTILSTLRSVK